MKLFRIKVNPYITELGNQESSLEMEKASAFNELRVNRFVTFEIFFVELLNIIGI